MDDAQFFRLDPESGADHGMVEMDADTLGLDSQAALFVKICASAVRLHGEVRLAAAIKFILDHMGCLFHQRRRILTLYDSLLIIDVRSTRMYLHGIGRHSRRGAHVSGKNFEVHLHLLCSGIGIFIGIGADDCNGVSELKDLILAKYWTVPAISLISREGDQTRNGVLALHVLMRDDLVYARHLFSF